MRFLLLLLINVVESFARERKEPDARKGKIDKNSDDSFFKESLIDISKGFFLKEKSVVSLPGSGDVFGFSFNRAKRYKMQD